jgi:hypothetical protein
MDSRPFHFLLNSSGSFLLDSFLLSVKLPCGMRGRDECPFGRNVPRKPRLACSRQVRRGRGEQYEKYYIAGKPRPHIGGELHSGVSQQPWFSGGPEV